MRDKSQVLLKMYSTSRSVNFVKFSTSTLRMKGAPTFLRRHCPFYAATGPFMNGTEPLYSYIIPHFPAIFHKIGKMFFNFSFANLIFSDNFRSVKSHLFVAGLRNHASRQQYDSYSGRSAGFQQAFHH